MASPKDKRRTEPFWYSLKRFACAFVMTAGDYSTKKVWSSVGSAIVAWWMVHYAENVLADWTTALAISAVLVGPHTILAIMGARKDAAK